MTHQQEAGAQPWKGPVFGWAISLFFYPDIQCPLSVMPAVPNLHAGQEFKIHTSGFSLSITTVTDRCQQGASLFSVSVFLSVSRHCASLALTCSRLPERGRRKAAKWVETATAEANEWSKNGRCSNSLKPRGCSSCKYSAAPAHCGRCRGSAQCWSGVALLPRASFLCGGKLEFVILQTTVQREVCASSMSFHQHK